jgi:hypothetical protein
MPTLIGPADAKEARPTVTRRAKGRWSAPLAARSEVRLDVDIEARAAALVAPSVLLAGDRPRLIDEWQLVPAVWNQVRLEVDAHPTSPASSS